LFCVLDYEFSQINHPSFRSFPRIWKAVGLFAGWLELLDKGALLEGSGWRTAHVIERL
jgi:hypothetical protein